MFLLARERNDRQQQPARGCRLEAARAGALLSVQIRSPTSKKYESNMQIFYFILMVIYNLFI
jgi:hypothetical protein